MSGLFIAIISGALMSVQGVFNTQVTKATHIWVSGIIVQATALLAAAVMWFVSGKPGFSGVTSLPHKYVLLGGVIGTFITFTVIRSIERLGIAKANLVIVITQIVVAYLIDVLGLFGGEKGSFSWGSAAGLLVSVAGVVIFSLAQSR